MRNAASFGDGHLQTLQL